MEIYVGHRLKQGEDRSSDNKLLSALSLSLLETLGNDMTVAPLGSSSCSKQCLLLSLSHTHTHLLDKKFLTPKMEEVKGKLRKLYNQEQHNLYSLPKSRIMRWVRHMRSTCRILIRKPQLKRDLLGHLSVTEMARTDGCQRNRE